MGVIKLCQCIFYLYSSYLEKFFFSIKYSLDKFQFCLLYSLIGSHMEENFEWQRVASLPLQALIKNYITISVRSIRFLASNILSSFSSELVWRKKLSRRACESQKQFKMLQAVLKKTLERANVHSFIICGKFFVEYQKCTGGPKNRQISYF